MNKFIFLCFGILILNSPSHAMDVNPHKAQLGKELIDAARSGNFSQVEALLKQGASIDAKCVSGWTALHSAAVAGHENICKLLIQNKAIIDAKNDGDCTPLHYAAAQSRVNICKLLIENKATIDAKDNNGTTPFMCCRTPWGNNEQICKLLINSMIKQAQEATITILGIKKYKKSSCVAFNQNDRHVIRSIAIQTYEISKQQLFEQINTIPNLDRKQRLLDYATQQLRVQKAGTSHE